ncbi:Hypothetical predicted protein [Podarcis lilfordi]|uniref:Uncharacterized protein n=1 Tax=Podarcis lilfordi TaxID=74358 RepID=A0AA35JN20_9SAUR|nr:Hypothetical predicted protein [Podarcis lilfordi]
MAYVTHPITAFFLMGYFPMQLGKEAAENQDRQLSQGITICKGKHNSDNMVQMRMSPCHILIHLKNGRSEVKDSDFKHCDLAAMNNLRLPHSMFPPCLQTGLD